MTHTFFAKSKVVLVLLLATLLWTGIATPAHAFTPYLQVTSSDNSNLQIMISAADANRTVDFYTRQSDTQLWTTITNIGTTDWSGYLNTSLNVGTFKPNLARESYVVVNGQQSTIVNNNSNSNGGNYYGNAISFSQNSVTLNSGQSSTISIYGSSNYYISNNTNSSVVSATISGSSVALYANQSGSSTITVCGSNNSYSYYSGSNCGTLFVSVSGNSSNGTVWFSPASPTLYTGQSLAVSINSSNSGYAYPTYNNAYYVSSNSNQAVVSASISGTVLNLYGLAAGTSSITITHSSLGWSGTVYVTVYGNTNNSSISFSNNNPSVQTGQQTSVSVYSSLNNYNNLYVSRNSNTAVVTANVNGSTLTLYGLSAGSSTISVCQVGSSGCGNLTVTVMGNVYGTSTYTNGQLINQNGTIYQVYKNTLIGFSNAATFLDLGFQFSRATQVSYTSLPVTYVVSTQYASHPWGSWVKSGQTIYFVHETGLIPVPSYDVFLNNGGQDSLVVPMNVYDWQRPQLPFMTYNDSRLR